MEFPLEELQRGLLLSAQRPETMSQDLQFGETLHEMIRRTKNTVRRHQILTDWMRSCIEFILDTAIELNEKRHFFDCKLRKTRESNIESKSIWGTLILSHTERLSKKDKEALKEQIAKERQQRFNRLSQANRDARKAERHETLPPPRSNAKNPYRHG